MYTIGKGSRSTFGDNYDDDFDKELFFEEESKKIILEKKSNKKSQR